MPDLVKTRFPFKKKCLGNVFVFFQKVLLPTTCICSTSPACSRMLLQCALRSAREPYCPQQVLRDFASPVKSWSFHSEENTFKARR